MIKLKIKNYKKLLSLISIYLFFFIIGDLIFSNFFYDKPVKYGCIKKYEYFFELERTQDKKKPWSKLEKAKKLKKLAEFAMSYPTKHHDLLKQYLFVCLNRKKLQRT